MNTKMKRILFINIFLILYSCGWLEKEEIKEIKIQHGYRILYDTNNIAFHFFSISSSNGLPIIDDCIEFFYDEKYLYVKQSPIDSEAFNFYKVNNQTKKTTQIDQNEYKTASDKRQLIHFYSLAK